MWRLTERMVRSTLVTAWRLATSPTRTSPPLAKATTEGVVREPSALGMTVGSPPSSTATTEFVVPRSMPTARAMCLFLQCGECGLPVLPDAHREVPPAASLSALGSTMPPTGSFPQSGWSLQGSTMVPFLAGRPPLFRQVVTSGAQRAARTLRNDHFPGEGEGVGSIASAVRPGGPTPAPLAGTG